ncbi:hypothetical protein BG00_16020 [Pseudoalteromonas sp. SCSIO_11900]|uniref:hypothetical protein n=1 Tax=Pseudoalteromonas sp. SCSIO_11900 TaxID=1461766 RepID=UPI0004535C41|nr:hypothetical protein [Pseudoalteromonas sp. SCSIO_11900]EWS96485.1 hypothetical protein BG00_16020 [Pseudoalteromonas sp. SCSIO_11900]
MNTNLKLIELTQQQPSIANDEDYIALYESGTDYIYYVRNYVMSQEFIVVSVRIFELLPEEHRPITSVFVRSNFYVIRRFKRLIREHLLQSGQLQHFQHLFDCSVSEFFDSL